MKTAHQRRIEDFMVKARQTIPEAPTVPSQAVRVLRARLILEEALETIDALGLQVSVHFRSDAEEGVALVEMDECVFEPIKPTEFISLAEIADGCADLSVVTIGTLSACGIPDDVILREVDANNLAKFGPGHRIDEHGKLIKPPGHRPPELGRLIDALGDREPESALSPMVTPVGGKAKKENTNDAE